MEYYQNENGTIGVPEPLQPYMGGQAIIEGQSKVGESVVGESDED